MIDENNPDANENLPEVVPAQTSDVVDDEPNAIREQTAESYKPEVAAPKICGFEASSSGSGVSKKSDVLVRKDSPYIWIKGKLVEESPPVILVPRKKLKGVSRRQFLLFGAGLTAVAAGYKWLLPDESDLTEGAGLYKDNFLKSVNNFDDAVAKSLYSKNNMVPTYSKSQLTQLPNNYAGKTPEPGYIKDWQLKISGLASGQELILTAEQLRNDFSHNEIISRMVCVEGWSAIAWWGGLRFADLLKKYPPCADTRWIKLTSDVNLDGDGNSDPYFVSMDLASALHPQTLLATHHDGKLLELEHGAPLRLLAPMKLGLKNIKAITSISYSAHEPEDYWNKEGYSYYDGI